MLRKRDKKNKRFGFIKTILEEEAGFIILNAKGKGGIGAKIKMTINGNKQEIIDTIR